MQICRETDDKASGRRRKFCGADRLSSAFCFRMLCVVGFQTDSAGADTNRYEVYKPTEDKSKSFEELQALNPEVIGWVTVDGTHIDYPVTQASDNDKYVNTDAEGKYSLAGSIFLDYRNQKDFTDFNSILYGHHMADHAMFGDLADFKNRTFLTRIPVEICTMAEVIIRSTFLLSWKQMLMTVRSINPL